MIGKMRLARLVVSAVVLTAVECAGVVAIELATTVSAQAQRSDDRYPFLSRRQRPPSAGGFFQEMFGPLNSRRPDRENELSDTGPARADHRAPSPHKRDKSITPTTSIVVIGDGMADWLAYGLEDAFSDEPEVAIGRQNKLHSGLLRYDAKGDLDWWHVVRDILTKEKANYVVMMLGVSDRENMREKDLAKEAEKQNMEKDQAKKDADKGAADKTDKPNQPTIAAPEPAKSKPASGIIEFRSERWATIYSRRIDETTAALKSKGVPVFWVGLPSIRGTKSTADAVYLNDLFRARAERAGVVYIDVWDGFVDDGGKYSTYGPDYEGQMRRLRAADGVFFTKFGARKLAHYVEREIRRYMSNRALPVALPTGPVAPVPNAGKSAVRPLVGPVVPLTVTTGNTDQLLGGAGSRPAYGDTIATDVLVKGEPINAPRGRADDFNWQQGGESSGAAPAAPAPRPAAAVPAIAPALARTEPQPAVRPVEPKRGDQSGDPSGAKNAGKPTQTSAANGKPVPPADVGAKPAHSPPPPPPPPRRRSEFPFSNPLGWLR